MLPQPARSISRRAARREVSRWCNGPLVRRQDRAELQLPGCSGRGVASRRDRSGGATPVAARGGCRRRLGPLVQDPCARRRPELTVSSGACADRCGVSSRAARTRRCCRSRATGARDRPSRLEQRAHASALHERILVGARERLVAALAPAVDVHEQRVVYEPPRHRRANQPGNRTRAVDAEPPGSTRTGARPIPS